MADTWCVRSYGWCTDEAASGSAASLPAEAGPATGAGPAFGPAPCNIATMQRRQYLPGPVISRPHRAHAFGVAIAHSWAAP